MEDFQKNWRLVENSLKLLFQNAARLTYISRAPSGNHVTNRPAISHRSWALRQFPS